MRDQSDPRPRGTAAAEAKPQSDAAPAAMEAEKLRVTQLRAERSAINRSVAQRLGASKPF